MPKNTSEQSKQLRDSSVAALLQRRWRFPHRADVVDTELQKRPIQEIRQERERLKVELTKVGEELAKVTTELKKLGSSP